MPKLPRGGLCDRFRHHKLLSTSREGRDGFKDLPGVGRSIPVEQAREAIRIARMRRFTEWNPSAQDGAIDASPALNRSAATNVSAVPDAGASGTTSGLPRPAASLIPEPRKTCGRILDVGPSVWRKRHGKPPVGKRSICLGLPARVCESCAKPFLPRRHRQRFCGPGCRAKWWLALHRRAVAMVRAERADTGH